MKTINPSTNRRVIKALKPRNPILVALKAAQCAKGAVDTSIRSPVASS